MCKLDSSISQKKMKLYLHPVNYSKMKRNALNSYCPVVSFLGPTGGGKSSLICKFQTLKYFFYV